MAKLHAGRGALAAGKAFGPPRLPPLTLRLRLTFWYSAVLAFIIALFGMVVYGGTSLVLIRQMDMSMAGTAQTILNTSHLRNSFDAQQLVIPPLDRFGVQRTIVQ